MPTSDEARRSEAVVGQREDWTANADDWAGIQEPLSSALYFEVLSEAGVGKGTSLLDAGCGSGVACRVASELGATVTGIDVTPRLIEIARERVPSGTFLVGEIEDLPVGDAAFDVVTAFASIMFASDPHAALEELARAAKPEGTIATVVPDPERSDWSAFVLAVMDALDAQPPVRDNVESLSEGTRLESLYRKVGLMPRPAMSIATTWSYPDRETTLRGMMSPGPMAGAAAGLGVDVVKRIGEAVLPQFEEPDGTYRLVSTATVVLGTKETGG